MKPNVNKRCVVCGTNDVKLTKHHIVPKRHLKILPHKIKSEINNLILLCEKCHVEYERSSHKEPLAETTLEMIKLCVKYAELWKDHFIGTMKPKFLSENWKFYKDKKYDKEIEEKLARYNSSNTR